MNKMKRIIISIILSTAAIASIAQTPVTYTQYLFLNPNARTLINNGEINYLLSTHKLQAKINGVVQNLATESFVNSSFTSSNGITKTGSDFRLGGALTQSTSLTGDFLLRLGTPLDPLQDFDMYTSGTATNSAVAWSTVLLSGSSFSIGQTQHLFTDATALQRGIEYAADYSATFSNRSLADKGYVDGVAGNSIPLTGTRDLTGNVVINGNNANTITLGVATGNENLTNFKVETSGVMNLNLSTTAFTVGSLFSLGASNFNWNGTSTGSLNLLAASGGSAAIGVQSGGTTGWEIETQSSQTIFTDHSSTKEGLEYAADYSANYSNRSLIDLGSANAKYFKLAGGAHTLASTLTLTQGTSLFGFNVTPVSTVDINGAIGFGAITTVTANATLTNAQHTILVDATSGNITINLPAVSGATRREYIVKKIDASANTVTIDPNSTQVIDDATTKVLTTQYEVVQFKSDGSKWWIIN